MKTVLLYILSFLTAAALARTARADVIMSPVDIAGYYAAQFLPWILVGAAAGVTAYYLKKYWNKKK